MKKVFKMILVFTLLISIVFSLSACEKSDKIVEKNSKNLSSYEIVATFNDDAKSLTCTETVHYVNNTDVTLNEIWFNLTPTAFSEDATIKPVSNVNIAKAYPNGISYGDLKILKVILEGKETKYEISGLDNNVLKIPLECDLYPEGKIKIEIAFLVTLPNSTLRFGYYNNNINLGNFYPVLCVYENGGFIECPYYSNGDPFYTDMANYTVTVTYPANLTLVSTGNLQNSSQNENLKTDRYNALSVRDFAMVLSSDFKSATKQVGNTTVKYYGYSTDENIDECLNTSALALTTFSQLFGEYPYKVLNVVKTPFMHGGMEYPNLVYISDSIKENDYFQTVIVHEIAHQWWYGLVGNNEIEEAWLDEALAEYSTILFYDKNPSYGKNEGELVAQNLESYSLYVDVIKSINGNINLEITLPSYKYSNEYEYTYMVYVKGVLMYQNLKETIGEENFIAGLKNYFKTCAFKNAKRDDLIASFERVTKTDLGGFFDSWLSGKTLVIKSNNG